MYIFSQAELEELKDEYLQSLKTVKKYHVAIKSLNEKNETGISYTRFEIGIVNTIITDLWESILSMETFLPYHKQVFLNKNNNRPARRNIYSPTGIDIQVQESPETYVCDILMQKKILDTIYRLLTPRQFEILYLYYYQNMSQAKIAARLHLSRPTVTEHLQKAIEKIKSSPAFLNLFSNIS